MSGGLASLVALGVIEKDTNSDVMLTWSELPVVIPYRHVAH